MTRIYWLACAALFFALTGADIIMGAITSQQLVVVLAVLPAMATGYCLKAASWS